MVALAALLSHLLLETFDVSVVFACLALMFAAIVADCVLMCSVAVKCYSTVYDIADCNMINVVDDLFRVHVSCLCAV